MVLACSALIFWISLAKLVTLFCATSISCNFCLFSFNLSVMVSFVSLPPVATALLPTANDPVPVAIEPLPLALAFVPNSRPESSLMLLIVIS